MKKTALMMVAVMITSLTFAQKMQEKDVPAAVKTKFTTMFPNTKVEKWEKEGGKFEAEFESNKIETSVIFEANGTYVQTEVEIPVSSLPTAINEYVKANLSGKKIAEATKITNANSIITYETEIDDTDYLFDANGKFISKEVDDKEVDDDDK
jgi:hypothetical protein